MLAIPSYGFLVVDCVGVGAGVTCNSILWIQVLREYESYSVVDLQFHLMDSTRRLLSARRSGGLAIPSYGFAFVRMWHNIPWYLAIPSYGFTI